MHTRVPECLGTKVISARCPSCLIMHCLRFLNRMDKEVYSGYTRTIQKYERCQTRTHKLYCPVSRECVAIAVSTVQIVKIVQMVQIVQ